MRRKKSRKSHNEPDALPGRSKDRLFFTQNTGDAERRDSLRYVAWLSHTCWVCRDGGSRPPRLHVSSRGYRPTSPCDTACVVVEAGDRKEAVRKVRERLLRR